MDCLRHQRHPTPPVSLLSTAGSSGGRPWNIPHPPPQPCSCRISLASSWHLEKFGKLKKNFFEEFVYFSPALPGSHSQEEEGKEESGGVGHRVESHKRIRALGKVGHPVGDPWLDFLDLPVSQPTRKTSTKCCQAHPCTQGLWWPLPQLGSPQHPAQHILGPSLSHAWTPSGRGSL